MEDTVLLRKRDTLRQIFEKNSPLMIAYSGGVDSTYLLCAAVETMGENVLGVIADSPSLPRRALKMALENARSFNAKVEVIHTTELEDERYVSNPVNRCYFCKAELFSKMDTLAASRGFAALAYGENADDAQQLRPGSQAACEFRILSPLREARLTKAEIRDLSRQKGLETADIPAQPCLSSRIPHGTPVTRDALTMIENAEEYVRSLGFQIFRVRYIAGDGIAPKAKLQVDPKEMGMLSGQVETITSALEQVGFAEIIVDPDGYCPPKPVKLSSNTAANAKQVSH